MIDWNRVAELREEIGPEDFQEVAEMFVSEVEEVIDRLANAPDPDTLERDLHFLKGSAWNLGFRDFGELCREGERRAARGGLGAVDLVPVISAYYTSRAEFLAGAA